MIGMVYEYYEGHFFKKQKQKLQIMAQNYFDREWREQKENCSGQVFWPPSARQEQPLSHR